jgi:hypothetical protein
MYSQLTNTPLRLPCWFKDASALCISLPVEQRNEDANPQVPPAITWTVT